MFTMTRNPVVRPAGGENPNRSFEVRNRLFDRDLMIVAEKTRASIAAVLSQKSTSCALARRRAFLNSFEFISHTSGR